MLALSTVTNMRFSDTLGATKDVEIVRIAESAEPKLRSIVVGVLDEEFGG